jgi:putative heme-binding domain-containing protein
MKFQLWKARELIVSGVLFVLHFAAAVEHSSPANDAANDSINLEALSRLKDIDLEANPAIKTVVLKVLEQMRGRPQFVEIVRDFKITGQGAALLQIASKDPNSQTGVEAMRLVLRENSLDLLKQSLTGTNALPLAEALGNTGEKMIVPLLEPMVLDPAREPAVRRASIRALSKVREGAIALLDLAKNQKIPEELMLTTSTELSSVHWDDLRTQAAQVLPMQQGQDAHPLPPIAELVRMTGSASNGAGVFRRESVGCSKCHQVNGTGIDFGPNLSEIGTKLAKEAIYESILDPSAGIAFGYEAWTLELKSGDEAYGLIVSETADDLALKAVGGVVTHYKKNELAKRTRQKLSIMPGGLAKTMSVQELVDLVEYLSSLKKAEVH